MLKTACLKTPPLGEGCNLDAPPKDGPLKRSRPADLRGEALHASGGSGLGGLLWRPSACQVETSGWGGKCSQGLRQGGRQQDSPGDAPKRGLAKPRLGEPSLTNPDDDASRHTPWPRFQPPLDVSFRRAFLKPFYAKYLIRPSKRTRGTPLASFHWSCVKVGGRSAEPSALLQTPRHCGRHTCRKNVRQAKN